MGLNIQTENVVLLDSSFFHRNPILIGIVYIASTDKNVSSLRIPSYVFHGGKSIVVVIVFFLPKMNSQSKQTQK